MNYMRTLRTINILGDMTLPLQNVEGKYIFFKMEKVTEYFNFNMIL